MPLGELRRPSGIDRAVAVLRAEPADLTARYGLRFERDFDNLAYHWAAAVRLPSGRSVLFIRYDGSPQPGTEVLADGAESPVAIWAEFSEAFSLDGSAATWRADDGTHP